MNGQALRTLVNFVSRQISAAPLDEQYKLYCALSLVMPTKEERIHAERIAWTINETLQLQQTFEQQLFSELNRPSPKGNGNGKDSGK